MALRKHQAELDYVIDGIIKNSPRLKDIRTILMSVVAGGGKGSVVVNAGKLLKAGLVHRICSIVPRQSLQTQCEEVCMDPFFQKLFNVKISIRASTNDINPCRGMNGFVTTYQALGMDRSNSVLREIQSKRYCVALDEFHHVENESPWHESVNEIINAAEYVILMSGTLSRANKKRIACVKYKDGFVDLSRSNKTYVIKYSRSDALRENAILPMEFHLFDSSMSWKENSGKMKLKDVKSFKEVKPGDESKALYTALNTEFSEELIRHSLSHWLNYKQGKPRAKILFVCSQIAAAKLCMHYLSTLGIQALIATSDNSKECTDNINSFKRSAHVLVTVAVAYEGLDVPPVSHICVLTRIRSKEWLEQMSSRATRVDGESGLYESQKAHIFAPEDKNFLEFVDVVESEQVTKADPIKKIEEQLELFPIDECDNEPGGEMNSGPCIPIGSQIKKLAATIFGEIPIVFEPIKRTPKQQEKIIRKNIDRYLKAYAQELGYEYPFVMRQAKKINGKARGEMTLYELELFYKNIKSHFPLVNTGAFVPASDCPPIRNKYNGSKVFDINEQKFFN